MNRRVSYENKEQEFRKKWVLEQTKLGIKKPDLNKFPISSTIYRSWEAYKKQITSLKKKYDKNPEQYRKKSRLWRKENPEIMSKQNEIYRNSHKEEVQKYLKSYRNGPKRKKLLEKKRLYHHKIKKEKPELVKKWRKHARDYYQNVKYEVLLQYSPKDSKKPICNCCKESMLLMLTIDHKNGRGTEHREKWGTNIYRWLKKKNYPKGYQTLCFNCNIAKAFAKTIKCPHKLLRYC